MEHREFSEDFKAILPCPAERSLCPSYMPQVRVYITSALGLRYPQHHPSTGYGGLKRADASCQVMTFPAVPLDVLLVRKCLTDQMLCVV